MPNDCEEAPGSIRVLLVEDNRDLREVLARYLSHKNIETTACSDAEEARSAAAGKSFDVLLVDMVLPRERGPELVKDLRQAGSRSRVIIMSGYAYDFHDPTLQEIYPDRIILKPCNLSELAEEIRTLAAMPIASKPAANGEGEGD